MAWKAKGEKDLFFLFSLATPHLSAEAPVERGQASASWLIGKKVNAEI